MSDTYIPTALRRLVYERAGGRCEYCLIPDTVVLVAHQVDHIVAEKHGGLTEADNLALACVLCNKHKGSDLMSRGRHPETTKIYPPKAQSHEVDSARFERRRIHGRGYFRSSSWANRDRFWDRRQAGVATGRSLLHGIP
jgi:hypothetical protein